MLVELNKEEWIERGGELWISGEGPRDQRHGSARQSAKTISPHNASNCRQVT